jgi:predicted GNAT family N-acyltransferase
LTNDLLQDRFYEIWKRQIFSMNQSIITVVLVDWKTKQAEIAFVRTRVFVEEQKVPLEIELDDQDVHCQHVLAFDQNHHPVGTGRLDPKGKIGRMAVVPSRRGKGIGGQILQTLIQYGRNNGLEHFYLSAQICAVGFYEKHGFIQYGEQFEEAGIPHVMMKK